MVLKFEQYEDAFFVLMNEYLIKFANENRQNNINYSAEGYMMLINE